VIARADVSGDSLRATTDSTGAVATIIATHSNYAGQSTDGPNASIADGGGNQSGAPAFADAAAGDYRVAPGSPTIDAGLDDPLNGLLDLDGAARKLGTTDIGANELLGPAPAPDPDPVPPTTPPVDPPAQGFAGVRLVSTGLTLRGGFITVRLSCPAGTTGGCMGRTKLTARRRTLGRAAFSIGADSRAKVRVRVSRAGRRLFAHKRRLAGRAANAAHSGAGQSKTTVAAVTIRRRSR